MKATILIPIAALMVAGAATAVGVSMTSSAEDAPASPIVVHAPQRAPAAPGLAGSDPPAAPGPLVPTAPMAPLPGGPAAPSAPRVSAEPKVPPPPVDSAGVPAPPPAITGDWGDDDDDGGWDD